MSDNPEIAKLENLIKNLVNYPQTKAVRQVEKELKEQLGKIISKQTKIAKKVVSRTQRASQANVSRSSKMRNEHRYVKLVHGLALENDIRKADGTPITYLDTRRQVSRRRNGDDVSIPEIIWNNPSPG